MPGQRQIALTPAEERVLSAVDDLADEAVAFTRALVRIPTVNPPGQNYAVCSQIIAERLSDAGYAVGIHAAEGLPEHNLELPRPNVLAVLPGPEGGKTLHFNGHYDVVPAGSGWTDDPFSGAVRDGRIYGRGSCDQKGGIAASIFAVEAIRRAGVSLSGTVEQSATADEESGGFAGVAWLCDRGLIASARQDYVVITEPLDPERVCVGHRGVYWFDVTTLGAVGHGSMPGLAVNAVDLMTRLLHAIEQDYRPRLATRLTRQPVEPEGARRPSINVNAIHAGQSLEGWQTPTVPDRCTAVFDRRYLLEETFEDVRAEIVDLLERLHQQDGRFRYELRDRMRVDALVGTSASPLVVVTEGAIKNVTGLPAAAIIHSPGTYDQKHVVRRGGIQDCIAYGPGRLVLAHQPDEWLGIADLVTSMKVMALLTMRLLGMAP